eukprot:m.357336 g.357336  ORF g.357336 m.357336 type:complete len:76 (+) comp55969_c0_seq15:1960-2187(+)
MLGPLAADMHLNFSSLRPNEFPSGAGEVDKRAGFSDYGEALDARNLAPAPRVSRPFLVFFFFFFSLLFANCDCFA